MKKRNCCKSEKLHCIIHNIVYAAERMRRYDCPGLSRTFLRACQLKTNGVFSLFYYLFFAIISSETINKSFVLSLKFISRVIFTKHVFTDYSCLRAEE